MPSLTVPPRGTLASPELLSWNSVQMADRNHSATPLLSVVMANFEAGDTIVRALRSVLDQTVADLEIIVSDDGSADQSLAHVRHLMALDPRIRLLESDRNHGPAHCRNRALAAAQGTWIAIVDSDDILHPERFERLLAAATVHDADIVADDLLLFFEDGTPPSLMLGDNAGHVFMVSPERWVLAGVDGSPSLGYLKPLIRADRLGTIRYDETLRIGEDYDLVLRLLLSGVTMLVVPEPYYLYRRHSGSISHRLSVPDMEAMLSRQVDLLQAGGPFSAPLTAALNRRIATLRQGLSYERLIAAIKNRRVAMAATELIRNPGHVARLWRSFREGRNRRATPRTQPAFAAPKNLSLGAATVPAYIPPHATDWSAPRPRTIWRDLAANRGAGVLVTDAAGRYAAGFIPEAQVTVAPSLETAS